MKSKCRHNFMTKISHWWFRFECDHCHKRFRWISKFTYVAFDNKD